MKSSQYLFLNGIRGWASFIVLLGHLAVGLFAFTIPAYGNLKLLINENNTRKEKA